MWAKLDPKWQFVAGIAVFVAAIVLTVLSSGEVFAWIVGIFMGAFITGQGLYRLSRRG